MKILGIYHEYILKYIMNIYIDILKYIMNN
jgi:hypothetical protein